MTIDAEKCTGCGGCVNLCPALAIGFIDDAAVIDNDLCTECGLCAAICGAAAPQPSGG